jgi:hypothetical protein
LIIGETSVDLVGGFGHHWVAWQGPSRARAG